MSEAADHPIRFHRPRKPWETLLYRLFEEHFDEFERVYPDRFQRKYGFWRPVVRRLVNDYLDCGEPREGFARVRCPDCRHEFFVAFSCKQWCICPSCHQKRTLITSINIAETICAPVPWGSSPQTLAKGTLSLDSRGFVCAVRRLANRANETPYPRGAGEIISPAGFGQGLRDKQKIIAFLEKRDQTFRQKKGKTPFFLNELVCGFSQELKHKALGRNINGFFTDSGFSKRS